MALVANTSARSLFYSFKKSRGVSPMTFVKQVRLRKARSMLTGPNPATSVTSVAIACGFSNLGHFARYYCSAFGEHPSDTLRKAFRRSGFN
ncbi:helix-turn-helix domain-containing protein [Phyllobacterium lublinensis]|uniref:helix-turn-helix domain-containing protein n=1 Tax=Phyllobacterium lublinensis TaxID=2875708 RepID=UPI001CCAC7DF|nr:helix-turn-helix domain-containing protein [Phyllobacterium sp. 2063]MBZ9655049.1 helix-turn-helix domain-containing protein [Phyllobacterium sp. 2063]